MYQIETAASPRPRAAEQPTTTNKQGKVAVRYAHGARAEKQLHREATERLLARARRMTRSRSFFACSSPSGSWTPTASPAGTPKASTEPQELAASKVLDK